MVQRFNGFAEQVEQLLFGQSIQFKTLSKVVFIGKRRLRAPAFKPPRSGARIYVLHLFQCSDTERRNAFGQCSGVMP